MKKLLLSAVFAMVALTTTFAADLNPFAYNLSSELSADQSTLTVYYSLNAPATGVKVLVMNGDVVVKEVDCNAQKTLTGGAALSKGDYKVAVGTSEFPLDTDLTWKVVVKGVSVQSPTLYDKTYAFYHPSAVDIDNNPENKTFGLILTNEAMQEITSLTASDEGAAGISYSEYRSYTLGAGVYAFNPAFEPIVNGKKPGFNGGNLFTQYRKHNSTAPGNSKVTAYAPRRIRISKDGRIFVTSLNTNGDVLWEIDPTNLDSWTPVFQGLTQGQYQDLYNGSTFVAGPNAGFDVRGSGKDLKLLMLSANTLTDQLAQRGFRISQYNLGEKTTWDSAPSKSFPHDNHENKTQGYYQCYFIVPTQSQVQYDKDGGVWYISFTTKTSDSQPGLVHFTANGEKDYQKNWNNVRNGGFRFNHDFSKVIIAGNNVNGSSGETKKSTVYSVSKDAKGAPVLSDGVVIDMSTLGNNLNDFAWDYAGNLYGVSNSNEKIAAWAMPYSGTVSTPAASKYTFEITKPNYDHPENHLAPFAYDLRKTIEGDGRTKLHFMLNAHAKKVQVVLIDEETKQEILLREYPNAKSEYKDFIPYHTEGYGTVITTEDVETLGLDYGKDYSWRVDVWGKDVAAPNRVKSYSFYHPSAVDIDNNPENETFGLILTNEALHEVKDKSTHNDGTTYVGAGFGAGLYAFTADFKPIKNGVKPGFNGGKTFTTHRPGCTGDSDVAKAHTPRRIRISDDGRIFVTSLNTNGDVLWEVDPTNLDSWSPVFQGLQQDANKDLVNGTTFVAGPNAGFDVRGSGENLQLLMLSANEMTYDFGQIGFRVSEYNLGEKRTWSYGPSKSFPHENYKNEKLGSYQSYFIASINAQVQYDKDGGVWYIQYRAACTNTLPALVHFTANGVEDYKNSTRHATRNAGFRFNDKFTKVIIAGIDEGTEQSKKATIYAVSKDADGKPVLTKELVIDMSHVGNNLNDFAWDYAGNLYVCGNSNEKVAAYVMPRSANDKVSTPARDEFVVNLTQPVPRIVAYNLTYRPNGANQTYDFSFYANTQPTGGSISFYKNGETTPLYVHQISNLIQGDNTVPIPMATLDAALNMEKDITWELTLSAPQSQVFGRIYKSGELNTAYATINTNPATDYFGHIYANSQAKHAYPDADMGGGEMFVWEPGSGVLNNTGDRYHTILENRQIIDNGFEQGERLCVAPDGKVYISDNGIRGGIYIMDPKEDYSTTSFFNGLTFKEGNTSASSEKSLYYYNSVHVGSPSSCSYIYWPGGDDAKLFATRTEYYPDANVGSHAGHATYYRHNEGYFVYDLKKSNNWQHDWATDARQKVTITLDNLYSTDFAIVGTSHGAWICQHRSEDEDRDESRSLMFFGNDGERKYCSDNNDVIYGSAGAALAVNKEENLLAMASGTGGIIFFDITWNNDVPTLSHKYTSWINDASIVTTLNFDYAGNLVATIGNSYNDRTDQHRVVLYTLPKAENTVTVPARFSQRVAALYADERMDVHFDENITKNSPYQTVDVFRRLQAGMCNTICLPFSIENKVGTPYEKTKIFAFTGVNPGNDQVELQFSEVDAMQAGVPYLIQPENDITDLLRFSPVQVNANFNNEGLSVTQGSGKNAITFHGAIDPTTLSVNQNYLFLVANNRLATASAGGDMLGMRGYFTVKGEFPAKAVISFREGVTTGTTSTVTPTTDGVQKVLQNQQILIIRDGEIYNILGEHINTK